MSILSCLDRLAGAGKITEEQANDARAVYRGILNEDLFRSMDKPTAEAYAALKTAEILEQTGKAQKIELARRVEFYNTNIDRIKAHPNGPIAGFMGLMDRDIRNAPVAAGENRLNVSSLETEYYRPTLANKMHELDTAYRSTAAGLKQDITGIRNMISELFGVKTGDETASHAAKGLTGAMDWGIETARKLGKAFETTEDYRLPQFWSTKRVNKFGEGEFKSDIQRHIDAGGLNVFDRDAGKIVSGAEREAVIQRAVKDIRMDLSSRAGPASIFKDEARVFRFAEGERGAAAYLELMDKYGPGQGQYYSMIQTHMEKMARELSLLHVLGPGYRSASEQLLKDAVVLDAERNLQPTGRNLFERMGDGFLRGFGLESHQAATRLQKYMTGQLSGADSEVVAGFMQGVRSFLTSTNMGSAIVTAVPADTVNWAMAANYRGLNSGRMAAAVTDYFLKDNPDKEAFAARLGIVAHAASRAAIGTRQFGDQIVGTGVMSRLADSVVRVQGLHAWDAAINRSFTMEFLASLAERKGVAFDALDKDFKRFITDYGFTREEWGKLAVADHLSAGPAKFLLPDSLEENLRVKLMSAIGDEKQFAYLAGSSNRVRALASGGVKAGSLPGEAARSFFFFKQFPLSMMATHGVRAAQEAAGGHWGQAAALASFMTMAGAVAIQARQVLMGKDPQSMADGWFWAEAAFQGGAAGYVGDLIKEGMSGNKTSMLEAVLGPVSSPLAAVSRATSGARRAAEHGENVNFGAILADDIQKFTPGGNLWYTRLLVNRFLFDNVRKSVDADYGQSFARQRERMAKLHHQEFYFAPGDSGPMRAPDLGAMFRGH